ncbi:MAG TPA: DUF885 family protein [Vicinamibacterales bacterium]|nr:DUF885 family protein [Vicinamibacterales bacterium]
MRGRTHIADAKGSASICAVTCAVALTFAVAACGGREPASSTPGTYTDLVALFKDWRAFQAPALVNGVPDYRAEAMAAQHRELANYRRRLVAIDPSAWPIPQQVDYHIVRAEMNGLDFDHRVLRPWANDPAFYVAAFGSESDQPAREGHFARGSVELWKYAWPLDEASVTEIRAGLAAIPPLLDQARVNLVGTGQDLWTFGTRQVRAQSTELQRLGARLAEAGPKELVPDVERARAATDAFAAWLDNQTPSKTGPSGIGIENYDWYLRNVELLPYTWQDELTLMERELARAHTALALEELRNASQPPSTPIASADEYEKRAQAAVTDYMLFLKEHDLLAIRDYMDPAIRARLGRYSAGPREFFGEVDHHDPQVMRTHGYHWFDKARMAHEPHASPVRRGPLLYNIFITRTEGHATGWEEMMLEAGMFDRRPRSRELIYILLAQRAARAQGDLRMHARQATLEQAAAFTAANTPRGWLSLEGNLVRAEQHLYLRQPAYGTSYLIGKIQIERLLADRRRQLGAGFTMRRFMDEFDAAGLIPISLIRWELTGQIPDDLRSVLAGPHGK